MDDETEDTCIADDITECDCPRCVGNQLAWESVQGWHERDAVDAVDARLDDEDRLRSDDPDFGIGGE